MIISSCKNNGVLCVWYSECPFLSHSDTLRYKVLVSGCSQHNSRLLKPPQGRKEPNTPWAYLLHRLQTKDSIPSFRTRSDFPTFTSFNLTPSLCNTNPIFREHGRLNRTPWTCRVYLLDPVLIPNVQSTPGDNNSER